MAWRLGGGGGERESERDAMTNLIRPPPSISRRASLLNEGGAVCDNDVVDV